MLRVWLPLTKDLRNQGLSNTTATNSGATYSNTGGKLGGCYSFDGTDDAIGVGNLSTIVDTEFSWSCWFYRSEWSSKSWETIFGGPSGFELETKNSSTNSPLMYAYSWGKGTFTYELNQWNHLVMTRTTSETKFYLNGELKLTGSAGSIPSGNYFVGSWSSITGQNFKGKVNDVRIYDHCLSPMEVKELSKGLVLHYPLNRGGWGQENLLLNTNDLTKWSKESTCTITLENDGYYHIVSTNTNGSRYGIYYDLTFPEVGTYTLSADVKTDWRIGFAASSSFGWTTNTITGTGNAQHIIKTITTTSENNKCRIYISSQLNSSGAVTNSTYIKNINVEKGSIATPWCPNSSDALATTMGLNGTTEYDCSGFCNNGTKNGTYSYTSDTPKYAVSTNFSGTETIATATTGANILTLSCWAKTSKSSSTSQMMVADSASKLCCSFYQGNFISFYGGSSGYDTGSRCLLGSEYKENEWNHFVSVKTGEGTRDCYCNGVKLTPTTNDWWSPATGFWIGNRNIGGNLPFYGQICDVRAYATALSADDVKSLYQNSAYIDSSGNVYGAVH